MHVPLWITTVISMVVIWSTYRDAASLRRTSFAVNSVESIGDADPGDGVCDADTTATVVCTLSAAITEANLNPGLDRITFAIPGTGPHVILADLPVVTDSLHIDGYSQPGSSKNTGTGTGFDGDLRIVLDGAGLAGDGIHLQGGNSTVEGLVIRKYGHHAIRITGAGSNRIRGNLIGLDPDGRTDAGSDSSGISISNSPANVIGGSSPSNRNIIAGNTRGVWIRGAGSLDNQVVGNIIGPDRTGASAPENEVGLSQTGVVLDRGSSGTTVGGESAEFGNVISAS